jgi:uncharacterized protein YjbI with pentapeptide repeats
LGCGFGLAADLEVADLPVADFGAADFELADFELADLGMMRVRGGFLLRRRRKVLVKAGFALI